MVIQPRQAGKRRRKTSAVRLFLAFALSTVIFIGYKYLSAEVKGINKADLGNDQGSVSGGYTAIHMDEKGLAQGDLVLINKEHPYSFPESLKLVSIYDHKKECYFVRDKDVLLDKSVMEHLNDMMEGFSKETGLRDVNIVAGHRTYELQQKLYNDSLAEHGAEHTTQYVALPGCSEHHSGLAIDFSIYHLKGGTSAEFDGSDDYGWFADNSWKYGFVQRFAETKTSVTHVADEPWHFRYVGIPHAYYMTQNDLCLEEYIGLLRQYPYDSAHLLIECAGQKYEVYYCAGMEVLVPEKGDYAVSGNNADGFIVTVNVG